MRVLGLAVAAALTATAANAAVAEQLETGFTTRNVVEIAVPAAKAYQALGEIGRWWNGAHTYSGKAENMTLPLTAGGCFCETLPNGGGARHGVVALAIPGQLLRLETALGPLQGEGVAGALTFEIKAKGQGVEVTQTYKVGGATPATAKAFAGPVDGVVKEQLERFKRYLETGKP